MISMEESCNLHPILAYLRANCYRVCICYPKLTVAISVGKGSGDQKAEKVVCELNKIYYIMSKFKIIGKIYCSKRFLHFSVNADTDILYIMFQVKSDIFTKA